MKNTIQDFPLILLAGGKSSRMGTPKGLLDYQGQPWLLEQFGRFEAAPGKRMVVVLGHHAEQYFERMNWLRTASQEPTGLRGLTVSVVINRAPENGPFSSLQCAIAFLKDDDFPGAFVLPIDVPGPDREVFEAMTRVFGEPFDALIPRYQSKGGHPVLLSRNFLNRLAKVSLTSAEARLDFQIQALPKERVASISVHDQRVCLNMNSPDDFLTYSHR
jgi:CTP:molybdopterin cytidylyltransferase MocA